MLQSGSTDRSYFVVCQRVGVFRKKVPVLRMPWQYKRFERERKRDTGGERERDTGRVGLLSSGEVPHCPVLHAHYRMKEGFEGARSTEHAQNRGREHLSPLFGNVLSPLHPPQGLA